MVWLVCALGRRREVCWVIRRIRIVGVGIEVEVGVGVYWSTRGRGEVVRLRKVARVVRMGSGGGDIGGRGTIVGAVGACGVG